MKLTSNDLTEIVNNLSLTDDVKISDIPDLELYMDQLTSFFDSKLGNLKRQENDKILTKTMINNYTKDGLLMPPKNKRYSKQHVIMLILIYYLKQILSIEDIHSLIKPILNDMNTIEDDIISLEDIYSIFLDVKKLELDNYYSSFNNKLNLIESKLSQIDEGNKDIAELFLTVVTLIAQADAQKRLAEKLIDNYFKKHA